MIIGSLVLGLSADFRHLGLVVSQCTKIDDTFLLNGEVKGDEIIPFVCLATKLLELIGVIRECAMSVFHRSTGFRVIVTVKPDSCLIIELALINAAVLTDRSIIGVRAVITGSPVRCRCKLTILVSDDNMCFPGCFGGEKEGDSCEPFHVRIANLKSHHIGTLNLFRRSCFVTILEFRSAVLHCGNLVNIGSVVLLIAGRSFRLLDDHCTDRETKFAISVLVEISFRYLMSIIQLDLALIVRLENPGLCGNFGSLGSLL